MEEPSRAQLSNSRLESYSQTNKHSQASSSGAVPATNVRMEAHPRDPRSSSQASTSGSRDVGANLQAQPHSRTPRPTPQEGSSRRNPLQACQDFYSFELMPKTFLIKFRQQIEGFQLGANFEVNGCTTKFVFKPAFSDNMWKVVCEPKQGDLRLLTKKIPIGPLLHLQVGLGHDFHKHTTGWKWKVTSSFGETGLPEIRQKTVLPIFPGFDISVGWNAQYELPDLRGALGTGEPHVEMNVGRLHASIEQVAAIYTHVG